MAIWLVSGPGPIDFFGSGPVIIRGENLVQIADRLAQQYFQLIDGLFSAKGFDVEGENEGAKYRPCPGGSG